MRSAAHEEAALTSLIRVVLSFVPGGEAGDGRKRREGRRGGGEEESIVPPETRIGPLRGS